MHCCFPLEAVLTQAQTAFRWKSYIPNSFFLLIGLGSKILNITMQASNDLRPTRWHYLTPNLYASNSLRSISTLTSSFSTTPGARRFVRYVRSLHLSICVFKLSIGQSQHSGANFEQPVMLTIYRLRNTWSVNISTSFHLHLRHTYGTVE